MNKNNLLSSTSFLLLSSIIFVVSGYLIHIWLGKELGPIEYGIYGVIISLMTTVNIIQSSGLPQATSKFIASGKHDNEVVLKASLRLQIISTLILALVFFALAQPLALLLNDAGLTNYIRASSLILPFYAILSLYISYYNGLHEFKKQASLSIVYSITKLISVIGLVYVFHLYGAIVGFIISPIVALLFGFHLPKAVRVDKTLYRALILFSLPLIGYAILSTLQLSVDLFFVKALVQDNLAAGLYTAGQNIARIPYYALSAFALILFPVVTKSINTEDKVETGKKIRQTLRYLFLLLIPGTVLIASTSRELLTLLYSTDYILAGPSLTLLVIGLAFLTIFNALTYVMVADNKPLLATLIAGAGVGITGIICWLAIPLYGLTGAAWGTTLGAGITTLISFFLVSRRFPHITPWVSMGKIVLASALMYTLGILLHLPYQLLPVTYLVLMLSYGLILFFLKEITKNDLEMLRAMIPTRVPLVTPHE